MQDYILFVKDSLKKTISDMEISLLLTRRQTNEIKKHPKNTNLC